MGPQGVPVEATTNEDGEWAVLDLFGQVAGNRPQRTKFLSWVLCPYPGIVRGGDDGVHRIVAEPEGQTAKAFDTVVETQWLNSQRAKMMLQRR